MPIFANGSTGHWFTVNATAVDSLGGTDIIATNAINSVGTCTYLSNYTTGNNMTASYNCTYYRTFSLVVGINFTSSTGASNSTIGSFAFPDHLPTLSAPSISPSPAYTNSTLVCNPGSFTDPDGDVENTSDRIFTWFRNGTVIAGSNQSTLNNSSFAYGDKVSCQEFTRAINWTRSNATANSINVTIGAASSITANSITFVNGTAKHWFTANATATDTLGAADIISIGASTSIGGCVLLGNTTSGNNLTASYNCTSTNLPGTATVSITFTSTTTQAVATGTNSYPDQKPALGTVTITPNPAYASSILTCNNGTFSDPDADSENASKRAFEWYRNGTLVSGATMSTLNNSSFAIGDNVSCKEIATANYWPESYATGSSANVTIAPPAANSPPTIATTLSASYTNGHTINAKAIASDLDGATDIKKTNISATAGNCTYYSNSSTSTNLTVNYKCNSTLPADVNLTIGFTDSAGNYISTSKSTKYYDVLPSLTAPIITPNPAFNNSVLTCNNGTFVDSDKDTENLSARKFAWYRDGSLISGATTNTLTNTYFVDTDNIVCQQFSIANYWLSSNKTVNSSTVVIGSTPGMANYVPPPTPEPTPIDNIVQTVDESVIGKPGGCTYFV
jgi:hypothetical protein